MQSNGCGSDGAGVRPVATSLRYKRRAAAPARAPNDASKPAIARHAQATAPATELAAYRLEKLRRLESDGVDPATGAAHIPIERAMEILSGPPR